MAAVNVTVSSTGKAYSAGCCSREDELKKKELIEVIRVDFGM
jgi:hypothetical protein